MLPLILAALIVLVFLIAFMLIRTLSLHKHDESIEPVETIRVDEIKIAQHLADAIQCPTISTEESKDKDFGPWLKLHAVLKKNFPNLHKTLKLQEINQYSLLYTWVGKDPSLKPILFAAHLDVVPADQATLETWTHQPFSGDVQDGFVWGRGALDMKGQLVTLMESVEFLIKEGYSPKRTIYLAFGHDEEIYGLDGALNIARSLEQQGIQLAAVLDEGGNLVDELIPKIHLPMALVSVGEKGFLTLNISAQGNPGHSSAPPRQTAIGIVARALALLDDHPLPAHLTIIEPLLKKIGFALPITWQVMLANSWLFGHPLLGYLQKNVQLNAQVRTTAASTMMTAGIKDNILPAFAQAKVNFRLIPGDTVEKVIEHVRKVIGDPRVALTMEDRRGWEASHISPLDSPAYKTLELVIKQMFEDVPVAPNVFRGATDARHYESLTKCVYRFSPLVMGEKDAPRVHGIDERISIEALGRMVNFFIRLIRLWGEAEF